MTYSTRKELGPVGFLNEYQSFARYPSAELLMSGRFGEDGAVGKAMTWRIADDEGAEAAPIKPGYTFQPAQQADLFQAELPWTWDHEHCSVSELAADLNSGEAQLASDVDLEIQAMLQRIVNKCERNLWTVRSTGQSEIFQGIPYYINIPGNASGWTGANNGFQGATPTGHTTVAGVDPAVHTKYKNYADVYTTFNDDDFSLKVSMLMMAIDFHVPTGTDAKFAGGVGSLTIYLGPNTNAQRELVAVQRNDQVGFDSNPAQGKASTFGLQPTVVPILDSLAASGSWPIYFVNHGDMGLHPVFLKNRRFERSRTNDMMQASDMRYWEIRWGLQMRCRSRRRMAGMAKSAPFGEANI
jgi:hypothetical protein